MLPTVSVGLIVSPSDGLVTPATGQFDVWFFQYPGVHPWFPTPVASAPIDPVAIIRPLSTTPATNPLLRMDPPDFVVVIRQRPVDRTFVPVRNGTGSHVVPTVNHSGDHSDVAMDRTRGRLFAGTSGFSYAAWAPRFYAAGIRSGDLLAAYAERLNACELNNTFYQQPTASKVAAWLAATPADFRFSVKAQRGGSWRSMAGRAAESVPWLTEPY